MYVKENTNIVQANHLIESRPNFTKDETRLFLTIVGSINKDDTEFKPLQIPVSEFADLWGIEKKHAYEQIKKALRGLRNKEFFIEGVNPDTGKRRFITSSSISTAAYEEGEGYATVEVSQLFRPYLLELKNNYTKYVLENIMNLATVNAIRNYELLKQFATVGQRIFEVEDYKKKLHIEKKYPDNTDLKRYVIEPSVAEINEKTDIFVKYEFKGRGKRAKIEFEITNKAKILSEQPSEEEFEDPNQLSFFDEKQYSEPFIEFLATACDEEFSEEEIQIIRTVLRDKVPRPIDRPIEYTRQRMHSFLARAYAILNYKAKEEDIKNRFKYLKGILEKMPALEDD